MQSLPNYQKSIYLRNIRHEIVRYYIVENKRIAARNKADLAHCDCYGSSRTRNRMVKHR